jgi:hypothetical protein
LSENILPMQESGQLNFIKRAEGDFWGIRIRVWIFFADHHTEKQMIPHIQYKGKTIVFMADLLRQPDTFQLLRNGYDTGRC